MKRIIFVLLLILSLVTVSSADYVDIYPFNDSYVDGTYPYGNFGTTTSVFAAAGTTANYKTAYINFSMNSVTFLNNSNYLINSATLNYYVNNYPYIFNLYYVTSAWTELEITYNSQPSSSYSGNSYSPLSGWNYDNDITTKVVGWINGTSINYGIMFGGTSTGTATAISSREGTNPPYIRITYSLKPTVTNYSLSGYIKDFDTGIGISNTKIFVTNNYSTYSEEVIANNQGFWSTSNLSKSFDVNIPSTFYVTASKIEEYENSPTYPVTVSGFTPSWKNITLQKCVSGFNCFYNKQYVTFNTKYANGSTPNSGTVSVYYNGNLETNGTIGSDGSTKLLLFQTRYYYIIVNTPSASKSFYITPTSTIYNVVVGDIYGVLNDAKYYISTSNTSIWFNTTDPNLEFTNVTLQFGNATNTSINLTTMASSTARNFKFTPANITVPYKVTFTFVTQHYGNLSASRWVYITGAQPTLPAVTNLPAWGGNILAFVVSFVILFSTKGERNMGIGIFLMGLSLGIFAYLGVVSADISGTMLWQYSIPLICIIGVLTQMTRRN